jgi:hypothetical protein
LEALAFGILSKDSNGWTVHFHFEDGLCEGKALPFLWNTGAYFDEECLKGGKLHLFAHFERKRSGNAALHTPATSTAPSFSRAHTEAASRIPVLPSPTRALNDVDLPLSTRQGSVRQPGLSVSIPRKQQSNNVQNLSDSDSDGSDETHYLLSPSDPGGQSDVEGGAQSAIEPLPVNATAAQHALDFQQLLVTNAPKGKYGHKDNWDDISKEYKAKITHAKLIKGIYGSPAPVPCEYCTLKNVTCRIYHPNLKSARAMPGSCGECRLRSNTCVLNGNKHRQAERKRKATDQPGNALDGPPSKILRRGIGGTPTGNADHCPVVTCSRQSEPFFNKANFFRHVRAAHPDYDMSRLEGGDSISGALQTQSGRGVSGTFNCPVDKHCLAITRADNFRRHIRTKHPDSIHAHVLEAFAQKTRITLPNPPSNAEYTADFDKATSENAPPGSFGHRQSSQWSSANTYVRIRIAHAKLIHGKYGVLAPESCGNCKKQGTTCMVYHPHLDGGGRALSTYCGECCNRSVKCEIGAYPFAKILASTDNIDRDEDGAQGDAIAVRVEVGQGTMEQMLSKSDAPGNDRMVMKQEEAEEHRLAAATELQNNDHDSVIDDEDPLSPMDTADDAEEGLSRTDERPIAGPGYGGDETTTDTAFYQYSKYADQHDGIARN